MMVDKNEEKQISEFFLGRLNKKNGYDYIARLNNEEDKKDPDIDVYAKSSSGKYPPLDLQIVKSDGKLEEIFAQLRNKSKKTGQKTVMGKLFSAPFEEWISSAIKNKEHKHPKEVKKHLVLLVKFDLAGFNEEYAREIFGNFKTSEFLGIYAINLPKNAESSSHPHDGQIIVIKPIQGTRLNLVPWTV